MLSGFLRVAPTLVALGTSPLLLAACTEKNLGAPHECERVAIIGGEASPAGVEDAVLLLRTLVPDAGERLCGASLVAKNLAVTARHCVAYLTDGLFYCTERGELVSESPGAGGLGLDLPAGNLEFYANSTPRTEPIALGERVVSTLSDSACSNDLAFVVLDRVLELPILALRRDRPAVAGETVVAVGYGATRDAEQVLDFETEVRRRKPDLSVAAVGPDTTETLGAAPPRIVVVDGPSACVGDSGGPLLSRETNALLGVHSLIEGDCVSSTTRSWYTHVPPLVSFAEGAFAIAGATPTFEPDPTTDPCELGGCAGAGGDGGVGGAGGTSSVSGTGGERSGAGGSSGGERPDGDAGEEPTPKPPERSGTRGDGGCSLAAARADWSATFSALIGFLVLLRRGRGGSNVVRRADRRLAS